MSLDDPLRLELELGADGGGEPVVPRGRLERRPHLVCGLLEHAGDDRERGTTEESIGFRNCMAGLDEPRPELRDVVRPRERALADRVGLARGRPLGGELRRELRVGIDELVLGRAVLGAAHPDGLDQRERSPRPKHRSSLRPADGGIDPVERRRGEHRVEGRVRERELFEATNVELDEVGPVNAPPGDVDHARTRIDRSHPQAALAEVLGELPGAAADLDDASARLQPGDLEGGVDDLGWVAGTVRVIRLGEVVEHATDAVVAHSATLRRTCPRASVRRMGALEAELDRLTAETGFSGVVRIDRGGSVELEQAYGLSDRRHELPIRPDTRFAIASGTKGLTALTVMSLVEEGALEPTTRARRALGVDLPLIGEDVTVEHLLSHRSGIGDYVDEETDLELDDYLMPVPVHELATTTQYLAALDGLPPKFPPGERFAYCNSGYVVLALIAERVAGVPFHDLVHGRVCEPAGMTDTAFLRSDELPARAALGYLQVDGAWRTNVFHLPVRGSGDGGIYTTAADVSSFWQAFFAGRIVSPATAAEMVRARSEGLAGGRAYGLGFWLDPGRSVVILEGCDTGVSFRSTHDPSTGRTSTVLSNTADGAWPVARLLA